MQEMDTNRNNSESTPIQEKIDEIRRDRGTIYDIDPDYVIFSRNEEASIGDAEIIGSVRCYFIDENMARQKLPELAKVADEEIALKSVLYSLGRYSPRT